MAALIRGILGWMKSLPVTKFNTVQQSVGSALGISTNLSKAGFTSAVSAHLARNSFSYATLLYAIPSFIEDIYNFISIDADSPNAREALSLIQELKIDQLPESSFEGADGNVNTVNGLPETEFSTSVKMVDDARRNILEIGRILCVSPSTVVELSMRLNAVEPQHASLVQP